LRFSRLTETIKNPSLYGIGMLCQLPLPYRRETSCSELPLLPEQQLGTAPPAGRSLEDTLLAFRQRCRMNANETGSDAWESGRRYMTQAGFRVRSKIEKIIADFLSRSDLGFLYEPRLNLGLHIVRPDFYLTDYALPYEHFGLSTPNYMRAAEIKIAEYYQAGVPFMYTTFNDEPDLEDVIVDKLAEATLDL
jgi:hypothetical protein